MLAMLLGVLVCVGCGPKAPPPAPPAPPPADQAKAALQGVVNSGTISSDVLALKSYFEELKKTDAAKGDALLKDYDALVQIGSAQPGSQTVKNKAQQMLGKL
jgi:hypothetical protein